MNRNQKTRAVLPLDLQLFAGEGEPGTNTDPQAGAVNTGTAAGEGGTGGADKTLTFDELLSSNKDYQSAFDAKITSALNKAKKKWEQEKIDDDDEAKKLAKMSESERKEYLLSKDRSAFEQEKAEFEREKLKTAVGNELLNRNLPSSFADFLTGADADASKKNIDDFEKAFTSALAQAKENSMKGKAIPKDQNEPSGNQQDDFLKGFKS